MTEPYWSDEQVTVYAGDCLDVLRGLPDASVDAVVTDPPYGLEFMGREWDAPWKADGTVVTDPADVGGFQDGNGGNPYSRSRIRFGVGPGFQHWCLAWATECLRVLKPGGHLLAFGGTRTWHRLACAIEDAGFEVRDSIAWLYSTGFPKSLDVSKAIDRAKGQVGERGEIKSDRHAAMIRTGRVGAGKHDGWSRDAHSDPDAIDSTAREYLPATDEARAWQGWGTALKPAHEPIVVARRPLAGTVAATVLAYGTGALNVDECRVEGLVQAGAGSTATFRGDPDNYVLGTGRQYQNAGRWPPNVLLDGDAADELDEQSGTSRDGVAGARSHGFQTQYVGGDYRPGTDLPSAGYGGEGGSSRFFPVFRYEAKAPTRERPRVGKGLQSNIPNPRCLTCGKVRLSYEASRCQCAEPEWAAPEVGVAHPTVKPLDLMRWLVRLVTPPGGLVLDPFAGSGTTGEAAIHEHMHAILIEREPDYLPLIVARLSKPLAVGFDFGEPA